MLHVQLGRFCSRDPVGTEAGVNGYAYVFGSPITLTDASGFGPDLSHTVTVPILSNRCGVEIAGKLRSVLNNTIEFLNEDQVRGRSICGSFVNRRGRWDIGSGWDIKELAWEKWRFKNDQHSCATGTNCADTASVEGKCYKTHGVNYVLWGLLARYCRTSLPNAIDAVRAYRRARFASGIVYRDPELANDPIEENVRCYWTYMGYNGQLEPKVVWSCTLMPEREQYRNYQVAAEETGCGKCPAGEYTGTLTVRLKDSNGQMHEITSD